MKLTPETPDQKYWYAVGGLKETTSFARASIEAKAAAMNKTSDISTLSALRQLDVNYKQGIESIKRQYQADIKAAAAIER